MVALNRVPVTATSSVLMTAVPPTAPRRAGNYTLPGEAPASPVYADLLDFADEARRGVRAARSFVCSHLRVRAERPGTIGSSVDEARGGNVVGRLLLLHPLFEGREHVERGGAVAAAAVAHARYHEQPVAVLH